MKFLDLCMRMLIIAIHIIIILCSAVISLIVFFFAILFSLDNEINGLFYPVPPIFIVLSGLAIMIDFLVEYFIIKTCMRCIKKYWCCKSSGANIHPEPK